MNLVEGERVYVLEHTNQDWWFVKKHLTEEKGWVPATLLKDEPSYTLYVQRKLHEKIDKLPIFESTYKILMLLKETSRSKKLIGPLPLCRTSTRRES